MSNNITAANSNSSQVKRVYVYKLDHDVGINPNPFGKHCTLAYCKGTMREAIVNHITGQGHISPNSTIADMGIWVIGIAGKNLDYDATERYGHIVYAMQVTETPTFEEYWIDSRFVYKRSVSTPEEREMINSAHKQHYRFFKDNNRYQICGDNQEGNLDQSCRHILVSDKFEYYGSDCAKQLKLISYLELKENDTMRGYRWYSNESNKPIPVAISEYLDSSFKAKKCLARPTFSSPDFIFPVCE